MPSRAISASDSEAKKIFQVCARLSRVPLSQRAPSRAGLKQFHVPDLPNAVRFRSRGRLRPDIPLRFCPGVAKSLASAHRFDHKLAPFRLRLQVRARRGPGRRGPPCGSRVPAETKHQEDSSVGRADDSESSGRGFESRSSAPVQPEKLTPLKGTGRALQSRSGRLGLKASIAEP